MLDTQVKILSIDTSNFYSNKELYLHNLINKVKREKNNITNKLKAIEEKLKNEYEYSESTIKSIINDDYDFSGDDDIRNLEEDYCKYKNIHININKKIKDVKDKLLELLENKVEQNIASNGKHHTRTLREDTVGDNNIVAVFESYLTRTLELKKDELTDSFMVIQVYYFNIIKDLIYNGFIYKGEKYRYYTSSAGQIRKKKTVFIKESLWNKYEKTLMCGLTIDKINAKGGSNPNKFLAYTALSNSATDEWSEFDIDKTIVIDDFETNVFGAYDLIDDVDYSITRKEDYVPIPHTDGAGMILPKVSRKNFMIRLPWVKGLLGSFDFVKFIKHNKCSPIIKDIYGVEHNVIKEDIQIIFTKSQFKLWKCYDSWEQYKTYFKKYNCTAGITNMEEDRIKNTVISYQMLQSLTDFTEKELKEIANKSTNKLKNLCSSIDNIKEVFSADIYNENKTPLQEAISIYPNLINDKFIKDRLYDIKNRLVKTYKAGKLEVNGKYTFLLPDFYAACEYWFMGIQEPKGLLFDGEVYCDLFTNSKKLDCLRSPHLFCEHSIRENVAYKDNKSRKRELSKWFSTNGIYTSTHDLISKILQFDVDGDKALVLSDKTIIEVAERNIKKYDIVPLYYNMKKAPSDIIDNEHIYNGLQAAFVWGNIGIYSNNISKIWNSDIFVNGTDEEKQTAINVIKLLCMENNFCIDAAKTLYMPTRPDNINNLIKEHISGKLPHFFKYAKDKTNEQIEPVNKSLVNRLDNLITNPRLNFKKLGIDEVDYKVLCSNPDINFKISFDDKGKLIKEKTEPLILRYLELSNENRYNQILSDNFKRFYEDNRNISSNTIARATHSSWKVVDDIKSELSMFGYTDEYIVNILIKYLYKISNGNSKGLLWSCYGDIILNNIKNNIDKPKIKIINCVDCGEEFEISIKNKRTCRCINCNILRKKDINRNKVRKFRSREIQM